MAEKNLQDAFNDPANRKFHKIWAKESDIADDFEMGLDWFKRWSDKRDGFTAKGDTASAEGAAGLVQFWDDWLVKAAGRLAKHKTNIEGGKDALSTEFNSKSLTMLQPLYDALATLDDTQIKSGKAIFDALKPLMVEEPAPAQQTPKPGPLDNGNPFKKGPAA